jgi:kynurenine formamidase
MNRSSHTLFILYSLLAVAPAVSGQTLTDAASTAPDLPFSVHHNNLTQHGIHQIQNLVLDGLARDHVSVSCAIVLPLRIRGGAGSMVRPIAVGAPRR